MLNTQSTNMILWSISVLFVCLIGMGAVAFVTLLERKFLGLSQYRLGPNKVSLSGILQPVADGVKLLLKESFRPLVSQENLFYFSPFLLMFLFILIWSSVIPWEGGTQYKHSALIFFCCLAVMAYAVIMSGWSSTSPYSKMGSLRGILQSLSYEVAFILVFLWSFSLMSGFSISSMKTTTIELSSMWLLLVILLVLTEGNRAPFDLLEGESELISGFNIEMGSLMFVYLFLSEYGMILAMSALINTLLISTMSAPMFFILVSMILIFRSCYPRVRYDSLMGLMWKSILPLSTIFLCFIPFLK